MKGIILLFALSTTASCLPLKKRSFLIGGEVAHFNIPKGYYFVKAKNEDTEGYRYKDSSIFYVTTEFNGAINYENIERAGKQDSLAYVQLEKQKIHLSGVDSSGRYWRYDFNVIYGIGYKDVPESRKAVFDKVLDEAFVK